MEWTVNPPSLSPSPKAPVLPWRASLVERAPVPARLGRWCVLGVLLIGCVAMAGCSGGSATPPPPEPAPIEPVPAPDPGANVGPAPGMPGEPVPSDPMSPPPGSGMAGAPEPGMPGDMPPGGMGPGGMGPGGAPGMGMGMEGMHGGYGQGQETKQRPQDFAEWKEEEYLSAKKDNDFRLTEAVAYLIRTNKEDEKSVELLRKLLAKTEKPKEEEKPANPQMGMGYEGMMPGMGPHGGPAGLNAQTIQAIITALGFSGTPSAKKTLMEVFAGKFDTDDNATARLEALKQLLADPTPELEAVMFQALTQPEALWPDYAKSPTDSGMPGQPPGMGMGMGMGMEAGPGYGPGSYGNDQLMQLLIQTVDASASEEFRTKLAEFLLNPKTPAEKVQKLRSIIEKAVPDNIGAQLKMYMSPEVDAQTKQNLEQYFAQYSSEALARILGVIAPPQAVEPGQKAKSRWATGTTGGYGEGMGPGAGGYGPMEGMGMPGAMGPGAIGSQTASFENDPDLPCKIAKYLWNPQLTAAMGVVLAGVAPAGQTPGTALGMAPGMEGPGMTPGAYGSGNRFSNVLMIAATIPSNAMRVLLKQVLDKTWRSGPQILEQAGLTTQTVWDPALLITVKMLPWDNKSATGPRGRPTNGVPQDIGGGPEQGWEATVQKMIKYLCDNLATASYNLGQAATDEGFPVKVHKDAQVTARFDLDWPKGAPEGLKGVQVDPLRVHFLRIEQPLQVQKTLTHYRRQAKSAKERQTTSYVWFDRVSSSEVPGVTRSVDILITQQGAGGAAEMGGMQPGVQPGTGQPKAAGQNEMPLVIDILVIETGTPTAPEAAPAAAEKTDEDESGK